MTGEEYGGFWRLRNPILWGLVATAFVLALAAASAVLPVCSENFLGIRKCEANKWSYFLKATPNELGDTLAGFAGALAFVWLITTVWLQAQELSAQRQELKLARKESEKMAAALEAQADIFRDEKRQRLEDRNAHHVNQLLEALGDRITRVNEDQSRHQLYWVYEYTARTVPQRGEPQLMLQRRKLFFFAGLDKGPLDALLKSAAKSANTFKHTLLIENEFTTLISIGRFQEVAFEPILNLLREIENLSGSLSAGEVQRLKNLGIFDLKDALKLLLSVAEKNSELVREYIE